MKHDNPTRRHFPYLMTCVVHVTIGAAFVQCELQVQCYAHIAQEKNAKQVCQVSKLLRGQRLFSTISFFLSFSIRLLAPCPVTILWNKFSLKLFLITKKLKLRDYHLWNKYETGFILLICIIDSKILFW